MEKIIFILLVFCSYFSFGQSDNHIKVNGTKCSLIPPEGFTVATKFSGFQSVSKGASIMITELPAPYKEVISGFTADELKKRNMLLTSKEKISYNNSEAYLYHLSQIANGMNYLKQFFVFGDNKYTILIVGNYPESEKSIETEITTALLSTVYNSSQTIISSDEAKFSIDTTSTGFRFVRNISGSLLYNFDGKIPSQTPFLVVGNSFSKISENNWKAYAIDRIKKYPDGQNNVIKDIKEVTIDSLNGYEIIAYGKTNDDKQKLIYQTMLFDANGYYYSIYGEANDNLETVLESYKKVANTFKRK